MNTYRFALVVGLLAASAVCPRLESAEGPGSQNGADAAQTYRYLQEVGRIRALINADNKGRIPALLHEQDPAALEDQVSKIEGYKQDLSKVAADGVDAEALQFSQNFGAILDAYGSVCADAAELYRKAIKADASGPQSSGLMLAIRGALPAVQADTLGAVASLATAIDQLGDSAKAHAGFLGPIVQKLRDDRERLVTAKEVHHNYTLKVKSDFEQRYPSNDWAARDVLP